MKYLEWRYKDDYKPIKPIRRRGKCDIPDDCKCPRCNAPKIYLYKNNGCKGQILCKVCQNTFHQEPTQVSRLKLRCPYCTHALTPKKDRKHFIVHKCVNSKCPYYLRNLKKVDKKGLSPRFWRRA